MEVSLECVNRSQVIKAIGIEEGELPLLIVQVDPDAVGVARHGQRHPWTAEGLVHAALLEADQPCTMFWGLGQLALTAGGALDDAQAPVTLAAHHHLPVMSATGEAPGGQDTGAVIEALGLAGTPLGQESTLYHCVAFGELQEWVGSGGIQLERLRGWESRKGLALSHIYRPQQNPPQAGAGPELLTGGGALGLQSLEEARAQLYARQRAA